VSARRLLQALLLLQALAAAAIAGYCLYRGATLPAALAAGVGAVLLVRLALTANNFLLAARHASATPAAYRLGPGARLRMFGEEFASTMLHTSWSMPRARAGQRVYAASPSPAPAPSARAAAQASPPPVLLLHGYGCNSGYWTQLARRLDAARISHATLDLEPLFAGIDDYVPRVAAAVEALCAASGAAQVVIVAHSMGGLVARAYLRAHGRARVARVITLGTPHHGTSLASFGLGANAAQMRRHATRARPESDWLAALADGEEAAARACVTSIYTHHDNIVSPQLSSVLPGARNLAFGGVGHVALGRNRRILDCVMSEIAGCT
jgi:pimeloyl-ACP methyl ester carboxylesterase